MAGGSEQDLCHFLRECKMGEHCVAGRGRMGLMAKVKLLVVMGLLKCLGRDLVTEGALGTYMVGCWGRDGTGVEGEGQEDRGIPVPNA